MLGSKNKNSEEGDIGAVKQLGLFDDNDLDKLIRDGYNRGLECDCNLRKGRRWVKRFLVLQPPDFLYFYPSKESAYKAGSAPMKMILLERCEETANAELDKGKFDGVMAVINRGELKSFTFRFNSSTERDNWLSAIRQYSQQAKTPQEKPLTPYEQTVLSELKRKLNAMQRPVGTDEQLIRYLTSRKFEINPAGNAWIENLRFRNQNQVNAITIAQVYHEAKQSLSCIPGTTDRKGNKLLIFKAGQYSKASKNVRQMTKYLIYLIRTELEEKHSKGIFLIDLSNLNFNPSIMFLNNAFFYLSQFVFVGLTSAVLFFNTPWYLRAGWNVVKPFLTPEQFKMFIFLSNNTKMLQEWISKENLPKEYGGTLVYNHENWIQTRLVADKVSQDQIKKQEEEDPNFMLDVLVLEDNDKSAAATTRNSTKTGWMTKLGGNVKNWKKRYFVLKDNVLYYYKTEKETIPSGFFQLEVGDAIEEREDGKLAIVTPIRTYILKFPSLAERDAWLPHLQSAVTENRKTSS